MSTPTFNNKREMYDVSNTNGTITVSGSIRIKVDDETVDDLSGGISINETGEQIGSFNLMSVQVYDLPNFKYRTAASTLVDEILAEAMTKIQETDNV